jgi:hypothetical protein
VNSRCSVYAVRTGACRLFGNPVLAELGISELETCRRGITLISGTSDAAGIRSWLDRLCSLDMQMYEYNAEPYFIKGFTLHCWLDIYFDETLDFFTFREIREAMHRHVELSEFRGIYTPHTGLREKIDKIGILSALLPSGDRPTLRALCRSIRDDYPLTGLYYHDEAVAFLAEIDKE